MWWKDFLYICLSWPAALEHRKIEENTGNSVCSRVWGNKGIGNIVKHYALEWFYGDRCVNYCALKETIAKTCKHIQKTRYLGDFVEKECR